MHLSENNKLQKFAHCACRNIEKYPSHQLLFKLINNNYTNIIFITITIHTQTFSVERLTAVSCQSMASYVYLFRDLIINSVVLYMQQCRMGGARVNKMALG